MPDTHQLIHLYSQAPGSVIPTGIRFNDVLYAANLVGADEQTGTLADGLLPQMELLLQNMTSAVARSGFTLGNIARCTGYVTRVEDRDPIYGPWDLLFPNAADRPAFKVLVAPLPPGQFAKLDMLAVANGRRTRIDLNGVPARDPTVKCGNWVFTSRVHGTDPTTSQVKVGGPDAEIAQAFVNILELIKLSGGGKHHISQVTAFLRDLALAPRVAEHFTVTFPAGKPTPELNVLQAFIPEHLNVMLEMSAAL
jgi:enamine deaminase RidA (YjgF/YER057c/UK114 family)